jgi:hypothetical protein
MLHHFHGLETFIDRRVEMPDGLTTGLTTHRTQSEGVFITIVSTVVATVAAAIVVATFAVIAVSIGSPLLGLLVPNVEVVIFDEIARCASSGRDTPSATDAGDPLDG